MLFSIVVPTLNRPVELAKCLTALAALDRPLGGVEVVVVDDGGAISPEGLVDRFRDLLDVTLVRRAHAGPAAARNSGALRAKGEFLAFTDDDCVPDPQWLRGLAARLAALPGYAVGGRTVNGLPTNPYAAATQLIADVGYGYFNEDPEGAGFFAANNLALPADRFHELGGFDPLLRTWEDRDLCNRWLDRGWLLAYAPGAIVRHCHALTLRAFWRQHYDYGRGALRFHRGRARRGSDRFRPDRFRPDPSFYSRLLRRAAAERLLSLVVLAQAAGAAGFLRECLAPV